MTDPITSRIPEAAAASPEPTPGRALAEARAARGMTVTEVALRLKFSPKQLEALEAGRYDALAGPAFVRGMIRGYAKLVGIDVAPLIGTLEERVATPGPTLPPARRMEVPFPRAARPGSVVYVALSGLLVIAVAGVLVEWLLRPEPASTAASPAGARVAPVETVAPVAETPPPALAESPPTPSPVSPPAQASEKRIELVFDRESWVEVRDADGRVLFSQLNPPGSRRQVAGGGPFTLVIGNAAGVKVRYNDTDVDLKPHTRTHVARLTLK